MAKSDLEAKLAKQIAKAGLPAPQRHVRTDFITGRRYEADFLWSFPGDDVCFRGVAVEVQGGLWMPPARDRRGTIRGRGHANPKSIERDCEKMCLAQLDGWLILFVTEKMIRDGRALQWITEALQIGGFL
jgi:hypothetical protein